MDNKKIKCYTIFNKKSIWDLIFRRFGMRKIKKAKTFYEKLDDAAEYIEKTTHIFINEEND